MVRSLLSNPYVAAVILVGVIYLTLWKNRTIGVLLLLAFLLTMTRVTEHLEVTPPGPSGPTPPGPTPPGPLPPGPPTPPPSEPAVTSTATTTPAPAKVTEPPIVTPESIAKPTAPAVAVTKTTPTPVMSCNLESFAPF